MQHLAPIALFVYNRPEHTRRTINYLQANVLAEESRLFIFSDAAKTPSDQEQVNEIRAFAVQISGFKSVKLINREQNLGLAASIISGVSQLVNEYGKVIVFEDDLLSSPYTLTYFNEALKRYAQTEQVMQVAAYMFPLKNSSALPETFFLRSTSSWGWATWKRAWDHFDPDIEHLYKQFDKKKIYRFTVDGTMNYWKQLLDFRNKRNNSWAIRWHATVFLKEGLVLYPAKSLIENIGHDGSGVHSIIEDTYQVHPSRKEISSYPDSVQENPQVVEAIKYFFKHRKGSWMKRGKKYIINQWFHLKKKFDI
ncbi:glycosyltransferase [Olivibacter sp. SDN3]|uniref:glycosyltransferase n=1 Tax=Olivibacter sp. SDN3 TaxID=2764720 RepID=UPI00165128F2|nr:glycosyltransferase [Olivibacter sp. SDN3]QNL51416.1 glycosyltransferase [Olivibacter sp. SDN3]